MRSNLPKENKESQADKLQSDMIFFVVGFFILLVFHQILEFIFKPLRIISQKDLNKEIDKQIEQKRYERSLRQIDDVNDPMYQFKLRFVDEPKRYKRDPNNKTYEEWFKQWKKGNIIDSDLRWAPDVLGDDGEIRPNFIQYMKIQWDLHRKASFIKRGIFLRTIYKYYPELTPSMRGIENDLAHYNNEIDENRVETELLNEIQKFGLPERAAEYLVNKDINAETLRQEALFLKKNIEIGHALESCICAIEEDWLNKDSEVLEVSLKVLDLCVQKGLSAKVGVALLNKEITNDDVTELLDKSRGLLELHDDDAFEFIPNKGKTIYDDLMDYNLNNLKAKNLMKKI